MYIHGWILLSLLIRDEIVVNQMKMEKLESAQLFFEICLQAKWVTNMDRGF